MEIEKSKVELKQKRELIKATSFFVQILLLWHEGDLYKYNDLILHKKTQKQSSLTKCFLKSL